MKTPSTPAQQPAGAMQPGTPRYTAQALRVLVHELEHGTLYDAAQAAAVLTRMEQQLGVPTTSPAEPPVDDWDSVLPPGTITAACQQLRDRIDDIGAGYADFVATHRLLGFIEDRKGWPRSFATEPQVQRDSAGREL